MAADSTTLVRNDSMKQIKVINVASGFREKTHTLSIKRNIYWHIYLLIGQNTEKQYQIF